MSDKKEDFAAIAAAFLILLLVAKVLVEAFKKDEDFTSEKGRKILGDNNEKEKVLNAIKNGEETVETRYGKLYIQ